MKKNIRISLKGGIYFPLALLACCTPASHAVAFQTDTKPVEAKETALKESADTEGAALATTDPETADKASEESESDETPKSIKDQIAELNAGFTTEMAEWSAAYSAAKDPAEQKKIAASGGPRAAYAAKYLELYEANTEDQDALPALQQALIVGGRKAAAKPTKLLVEIANGQDVDAARSSCSVLIKYADTRNKTAAAEKLLELSNQATDEAEARRADAIQLLLPVANSPIRGYTNFHREAVKSIWELAKTNLKSTDVSALAVVGLYADAEASSSAFAAILEHHMDNDDLVKVLTIVPRTPTPGYEAIVQEALKNSTGDMQAQAAVSLAQYVAVRDGKLKRSQLNEEEIAALAKENEELRSALRKLDGDSDLHKKAQAQLFMLEKLSPGAEAMDIVGTDLNGEELKLSDYRGQVVFLDFWGDW